MCFGVGAVWQGTHARGTKPCHTAPNPSEPHDTQTTTQSHTTSKTLPHDNHTLRATRHPKPYHTAPTPSEARAFCHTTPNSQKLNRPATRNRTPQRPNRSERQLLGWLAGHPTILHPCRTPSVGSTLHNAVSTTLTARGHNTLPHHTTPVEAKSNQASYRQLLGWLAGRGSPLRGRTTLARRLRASSQIHPSNSERSNPATQQQKATPTCHITPHSQRTNRT